MGFNRSDIKISFNNDGTRFYVNEEKGTVVCSVEAYLLVPTNWDSCVVIPGAHFTEKGIAKCAPGDTFDVERGKRIALARAENNAYIDAMNYLTDYYDKLSVMLQAITAFGDKAYRCCAHNEDYIDSLSFENHPNYRKELKPFRERNIE